MIACMDAKEPIKTRLKAIDADLVELDQARQLLLKERDELGVALKVFGRFEKEATISQPHPVTSTVSGRSKIAFPDGAPKTIAVMITTVLAHSPTGRLTALEILAAIQDTWLPALQRTSLSPALSRMGKREELIREGHVWHLPQNAETGSDGTPPVSIDSQKGFFG
ncbi:MAG: hypothetical protein COB59_03110 [Rhodospirillaceae bacterium]|nr:MAG: hypothetical protein COB59_03110 [Rhodospirillaceae bacterium]